MKGYSYTVVENPQSYAFARVEDVDASFKDLSEVCARLGNLDVQRALELSEDFSTMKRAVLYKSHNKRLGHRKELGGQKGRYPIKAAKIVLGVLKSAVANAQAKGMIEPYIVVHISANCKRTFPRMSPKGRRARSNYQTSRVEVVLREKVIVPAEKKLKIESKPAKKEEGEKPNIEKNALPVQETKEEKKPRTEKEPKKEEKKTAPKKAGKTNIKSGDN